MTKKKTNKITCPNCEKKFDQDFAYCPHCGQKNTEPDLRFRHFFYDFLSGAFNLDSKFYRTFKILLLKPGKLSKEYLAGKRTKYMTPVRIYLIVSFVYFTLLSFLPSDIIKTDDNTDTPADSANTVFSIGISTSPDSADVKTPESRDESEKVVTMPNNSKDSSENLLAKKLTKKTGLFRTEQGKKMFSGLFRKYLSVGMFFLIPLTALIFYLMFYKGSYYIQHLVFVLHLQSVMFILFIFFDLIELVFDNNFIAFLNFSAFLFFLLIWVKKFYERSWWQTIWKSFLFLFYFGFLFIIFLIVVAGATYWNL